MIAVGRLAGQRPGRRDGDNDRYGSQADAHPERVGIVQPHVLEYPIAITRRRDHDRGGVHRSQQRDRVERTPAFRIGLG
jgi:hypothetical protein